jgi:PII-like signaling protein
MGFGANTRVIHTFKIERLSEDMPIVVEIVDTKEKLEAFLKVIDGHIQAGLVTLEKAQIRFYKADKK